MDGTFTMQGNVTSVRGATDYRQWCGRVRNRNETEVISKVMLFQHNAKPQRGMAVN